MKTASEFQDDLPPFHVMRKVNGEAAKREQRIKEAMARIIADAKGGKKPVNRSQ
jgi:hypothetical protein